MLQGQVFESAQLYVRYHYVAVAALLLDLYYGLQRAILAYAALMGRYRPRLSPRQQRSAR